MAGNRMSRKMQTIDIVLCGLFAALIAVGALFLKVPFVVGPYDFTFSLAWLFVVLAGYLLGKKMGTMSVAAYVIIGLCGVPVFAHGGGPQYVMRAGFGFLLGFIAGAFVIGLLTERQKDKDHRSGFGSEFVRLMVAGIIGLVVYYAIGIVYYYIIITYVNGAPEPWGFGIAAMNCLSTFLPDLMLVIVAALLAIRLRPALKRALHKG